MRIWLVASEAVPFAKTGGLADVAGTLPKWLRRSGHEVAVVMPRYYIVDRQKYNLKKLALALGVPMGIMGELWCGVYEGRLPASDVPVYFIEHEGFYGRASLYNDEKGQGFLDNDNRFIFLSRAALQLAKAVGFQPDIVHANDWHTGAVPLFLNTHYAVDPFFSATASVFTIHNMQYQGNFYEGVVDVLGVGWHHYHVHDLMHDNQVNLLKAGLVHATVLNTVSKGYAREIMMPAYGYGLDGVIRERFRDFFGIVNGIDLEEWNPAADPAIAAPFDINDLSGKLLCKRDLQAVVGLPQRDVPLIGIVSRLVEQKGMDVLAAALYRLLELDIQIALLGTGDPWLQTFFEQVSLQRGNRFQAKIGYSEELAHKIEAGADFFLMPSRFEPCGLNQLYSLRYGTLPIVRATGGLDDTVINYDEKTGVGTGFKFHDLTVDALCNTVGWAVYTWYNHPDVITRLRQQAMSCDYSWERSAAKYGQLYRYARAKKRKKNI